ncbi:EGF-like domain protein, partial [Ostertagia ostertagi]
ENECETGKHDCDQSAICHDNEQSFSCECPTGFVDRSPNKLHRPGRVCVKLVDECSTGRHTCSAQADCRDLEEGYTCECREGYVDRSPNLASQPGRVCSAPEVCPSNHDCSSAAVCEPLGGNKYQCSCIQGYVDQSPNGQKGRICVRNNACRDPKLNTCSRNAICYDEARGYRCECIRGFIDRSPDPALRGRVCEPPPPPTPPPRHPCQDPNLNDCHAAGSCRATGGQSYTCECLQGYVDKSPDRNKPGRLCILTEPVCLDKSQNDCHTAAICSEVSGPEKYTCQCRDGYIDQSPNRNTRPGRICVEMVNECLDRSLNDCHSLAICEDKREGYTCRCPVNTIDKSPDRNRPGRLCTRQINECRNPSLNTCSRFAECIDKEKRVRVPMPSGLLRQRSRSSWNSSSTSVTHRISTTVIATPCASIEKEATIANASHHIGMKVLSRNRNAECEDMDDGYICSCREGYYDQSPNPQEPGRVCLEFQVDQKIEQATHTPVQTHPLNDGLPCGREFCKIAMGEVCISGSYCGCRPGESRSVATGRCERVVETPMQIRVVSRDSRPLLYSSEYGSTKSPPYVEIVDMFQKDMARTFGGTIYAPRYVNTKVEYITHPKTVNSSWPDGLLFKYDVQTTPSKQQPIDKCDLWKQMMASLQRTNGVIGKFHKC